MFFLFSSFTPFCLFVCFWFCAPRFFFFFTLRCFLHSLLLKIPLPLPLCFTHTLRRGRQMLVRYPLLHQPPPHKNVEKKKKRVASSSSSSSVSIMHTVTFVCRFSPSGSSFLWHSVKRWSPLTGRHHPAGLPPPTHPQPRPSPLT